MEENKPGFNLGKFFFGTLIVLLGLFYLAKNVGWINFDLSFDLRQFWPLIIIFIGLSLIEFRGILGTLIGVLIFLLIVGAVIFLAMGQMNLLSGNNLQKETVFIAKEAGIQSAEIDIKTGAGNLEVTGGSDALLSGSFESNFLKLNQKSGSKNGTQKVALKAEGNYFFVLGGKKWNNLNLRLGPEIPMDLNIDVGATKINLDLTDVLIQTLDINTGASELNLILGDKVEKSKVNVSAGASSVSITLPSTVGVKLTVDSVLSSKNLSNFQQLDSNNYKSNNYDTADKKIDINLNLGVSNLNINWK